MSRQGTLEDERGFTLAEVMVIIVMMGIVFAIAIASSTAWFGLAENRRVNSATNQVVADLRLAHSQATNRLTNSSFIIPSADSTTYQVGPAGSLETRTLPGEFDQGTPKTKIVVPAATTIVFKPDGSAQITPAGDIRVAALDNAPAYRIQINTMTSRIQVVPVA